MGTTKMRCLVVAALLAVVQAQILPPAVTGADFNDTECGACLMTMSNLDTVLDTKESADQVKTFAMEICAHLPKDHEANCIASATTEAIRISKCMVQKANFPSYCHQVGICPSARSSKAVSQAGVCSWWNVKESKLNGRACNYIVNGMKLQMNQTAMRSALLGYLKSNFCPQLPFAKAKCAAVVSNYGSQIMNAVIASFDADIFCCDIGYSSGVIVAEEDYQKFNKWINSVEPPWTAHTSELPGLGLSVPTTVAGSSENPLGLAQPAPGSEMDFHSR